jgi:hypothetical protein
VRRRPVVRRPSRGVIDGITNSDGGVSAASVGTTLKRFRTALYTDHRSASRIASDSKGSHCTTTSPRQTPAIR